MNYWLEPATTQCPHCGHLGNLIDYESDKEPQDEDFEDTESEYTYILTCPECDEKFAATLSQHLEYYITEEEL